ncbi:MAG TPA: hypothetical protein VFK09_08275, partial [Gemmatimonadales bacterium]|nr:hypothetical protein [Gemmatimonadales bacterium]
MSPAAATLLIALSVAPAPASAQVQAEPPGLPASAQLQASSAARPPLPDSSMSAASRALARGLPWRATRILDAVVRDPVARTPDAVYLAATAAARWGGWSAVERLLASEAWLDTLYGARGRVMLARAVLEQGRDSLALAHAALAADEAADPEVRGAALVVMARGLEGVDARDSAAGAWLRASRLLPGVSDWLRLRAAGVIADSAARWSTYASLSAPAARAHVPEIEAALREKLGDYLGAARAYEALGDRATALRLRLAAASDSTQRDSVRAALVDLVRRGGAGDARASVAVLDSAFGTLAPEDELVVARTASTAGLPARAVAGYGRAFEAGLGTPKDRFDRGAALVRLGRYAEAAAEFGRVPARDRLGGAAAYQRARALLRDGRDRTASKALHAVIARFPRDSAAAAPALVLLADLATDARKDAEARRLFGELAVRFPRSRFAPGARFRGALIALLQGHANTAAKELDALAASRYAGEEVLAATYWAGRAWEAAGDTSRALDRWRALVS